MTLKIGRIFKFRDLNSQLGLAQIPLMIGLLIMAVAIPVATKLSEQNADTRNLAREVECVSNNECGTNYRCINNQCVYVAPTPKPTSGGTKCTSNKCSGDKIMYCRSDGTYSTAISCSPNQVCRSGKCTLTNASTPVSTKPPQATSTPSCVGLGKVCGSGAYVCCSGYYCSSARTCQPYVTSTPKPTGLDCGAEGQACCNTGMYGCLCNTGLMNTGGICKQSISDGQICNPNSNVYNTNPCSNCRSGKYYQDGGITSTTYRCGIKPTATPTKAAASLSDGTKCSTVSQGGVANPLLLCSLCKNGFFKKGALDTVGYCGTQPDKCLNQNGTLIFPKPEGCGVCAVNLDCVTGYCSKSEGGICRKAPTATPTYAGSVCCHTNQSAVFNWYLNKCPTGYEIATDASCRTPKPTIVPTVGSCKATGQIVDYISQCCSGRATPNEGKYICLAATCESIGPKAIECGYRPDCLWDGAKCVTKPKATATKALATVTPVCTEGSYKCSSQTLMKCVSKKWVTSDVCVTPEYCLATSDGKYGTCVSNNTPKCYCNLNCGAGDCNWQNAADSFYNRSCSFDTCSSLGVPTPKPTVVTTNYCYCSGNCGIGDCKWASSGSGSYTRRCDNQYCQGIPTQKPPTATPTSVAGCYCNQRDCYSGGCSWKTTASGYRCPADFCSAQKPTLTPSGGVVTKTPSGIVATKTPTRLPTKPPSSGSCSGAGADICNTDKLSVRAVCINGKWDYDEQLCGTVNACNRTEVCGGRTYYCGKDGKWSTSNDSCSTSSSCKQCPTDFACYRNGSEYRWFVGGYVQGGFVRAGDSECNTNGVVKPAYLGKQKGDGNCDGKVDVTDYSLWHTEYYGGGMGNTVRNDWNSDFTGASGTCDGKVTVDDFSLWYKFFYDLNNGN